MYRIVLLLLGISLCASNYTKETFSTQAKELCEKTAYFIIHESLPTEFQNIAKKIDNSCIFKIHTILHEPEFTQYFPEINDNLALVVLFYHNNAGVAGEKEENLKYLANRFGHVLLPYLFSLSGSSLQYLSLKDSSDRIIDKKIYNYKYGSPGKLKFPQDEEKRIRDEIVSLLEQKGVRVIQKQEVEKIEKKHEKVEENRDHKDDIKPKESPENKLEEAQDDKICFSSAELFAYAVGYGTLVALVVILRFTVFPQRKRSKKRSTEEKEKIK